MGTAPERPRLVRAIELVLVYVIYVTTARFGLSFDAIGGIATSVWPPTGVALAALCLRGLGLWPAVALAAFTVNMTTGVPVWSAAVVAAGNTLEAVVGAALLARAGFDSRLERVRDVLLLVAVGALFSTAISATFGLTAVWLGHVHLTTSYPSFWTVWWVGDGLGDLLGASFIFAWAAQSRLSRSPLRWLEALALAGLLAFVSVTVFGQDRIWGAVHGLVRGAYPTVPVLVWAALRFEQRGVTSALLPISAIAVWGATSGSDVFGGGSPHARLLLSQGYMAVNAVSMLILAAALAERRAAIRARDEFISIASHELKTPLTALKLRLDSATRIGGRLITGTDEQAVRMSRALAAANGTAGRLGTLVDDLLDASRLTAGRFVLRLEQVDVGDLLREVVGRLREQAAESGSSLELVVPEPVVGTWDRSRLEQVITNLLSNAIKYGAGKPIAITARGSAGHLQVQVKDGGLGIARSDHIRIFQPFERLATAQRVGGLGLGLYIGRQIALAHGGTLTVDSDLHHGAIFTLDLPLSALGREGGSADRDRGSETPQG